VVKKGWLWLCLDMVVYLDGGAVSVFPCVEGVGGGEGADGFDGGSELRFAALVCHGRARAWAPAL